MKTFSVVLLLAVAGGLSMSSGPSGALPSSQVRAAEADPEAVAVDLAAASPRPFRRVARRLDDSERDSVLGIVLLVTLQQGVPAR